VYMVCSGVMERDIQAPGLTVEPPTPRHPTHSQLGWRREKKSQLFKGGFSCFLTQKREENEGDFYYTHIHLYIYEYNIFKTTFQQPAKFLLQITTNSR